MIKIENVEISGWQAAIRGMRNPLESWERSDSVLCVGGDGFEDCTVYAEVCPRSGTADPFKSDVFCVGKNDLDLMRRLSTAGSDHSKYLRYIVVTLDVVAPLYWWKEASTYKVGTVANSCSTMHKLHTKPLFLSDFSHDHLEKKSIEALEYIIAYINDARDDYIASQAEKDLDWARHYWYQMIQLLPSSYNQRRTLQVNYQVLKAIYHARRNHKLDEWRTFCSWIESLPYSEIITLKEASE